MRSLTVALVLVGSIARAMVINTIDSISATVLSGTSVRVDWTDNATNSAGYRIERCSSNCALITGSWTLVGINGPGVKSFTDTGLSTGTAYQWRVAEDPYMSASATPTSTTTTTTVTTTTTTGSVTTTTVASGLVGFVPGIGDANDVSVSGSNIYVASTQFGLAVASINPFAVIGNTRVPFTTQVGGGSTVTASGSVAAVVNGVASTINLRLFDISTPSTPVQRSAINGVFNGIALVGTKLYTVIIVSGNPGSVHFYSYDITDLTNPVKLSDLPLPSGGAITRCMTGTCFASGGSNLYTIDISSTPVITGTKNLGGTVRDLSIVSSENKLYAAAGSTVQVLDITTPASPSVLGTVTGVTPTGISAKAGGVVVMVDGLNMKTIDASTASAPVVRATVTSFTGARVAISGNFAYIPAPKGSNQGLVKYDVSNLAAPVKVANLYGGHPTENSIFVNTTTNIAAVSGSASGSPGVKFVDISTPSVPVVKSTYTNGGQRTTNGVAISGTSAFTIELIPGNPGVLKFITLNISNPSVPTLVGSVTVPGASIQMKVIGSRVYTGLGAGGLGIINFSNLSAPYIEGQYDTPGSAAGIDIVGTTAYIADTTSIMTFDVSNPASPVLKGSLAASCISLSVANNVAWCTDGINIRKFNVTNVTSPTLLTTVDAHQATRVLVNSNHIYGVTGFTDHSAINQGLQIWDWDGTTSTTAPTFVRQIITPGTPNAGLVFGSGNLILTGDEAGVLSIISP